MVKIQAFDNAELEASIEPGDFEDQILLPQASSRGQAPRYVAPDGLRHTSELA